MPRLLDYLNPAYAWLAALDPSLPRALFVALVFGTVLLWRKVSPGSWLKFSSLIPVSDEDTSWLQDTLRKLWQAVPAAVLGAVYGALGTGGDIGATVKLALLGLAAPVIHEVAWRYKGNLGKPKPTAESIVAGTPLLALVCAGLLGMSQHSCNRDARPCSAEDLASGPLAAHNARCAADRQARFPDMPDETCDATPECAELVAACDRFAEERCR